MPLGPFNNVYGMGASPVLVDDKIVLVIDQSGGSYIAAFGQTDGKQRWKTARPEALSGHSTPRIIRDANGKSLIVAPASFRMDVYSAETGEIVWFMHGLASEMKSVPIDRRRHDLHQRLQYAGERSGQAGRDRAV